MSRHYVQPLRGSLEHQECFGALQAGGEDALDAPQMPGQSGSTQGLGAGPGWEVRDPPRPAAYHGLKRKLFCQ